MPSCVACAAELAPTVRTPHTVYVKSLLSRIAGQDYCRDHIVRAAVAASVVTEIKPSTGTVAVARRGAPSAEYDQPLVVVDALGLKTVETWSWPTPARLVGQRIAILQRPVSWRPATGWRD